jgi:protein SCO1/2
MENGEGSRMNFQVGGVISKIMVVACIALFLASCEQSKPTEQAERHQLKGTVVSIDKPSNTITVDHEAIPGFMSAMTMPYTVKSASALDGIQEGDSITADVVVLPSTHAYWLENVVVTGHAKTSTQKPSASFHMPTPGENVPDFVLTNQDGKRISLRQYRGKALLVTFIYTRCPFQDYCPLTSHQFSEINRELHAAPALLSKVHLLSVSFDPQNDTPKVLRDYGFSNSGERTPQLFNTWEFAVAPVAELPKIADFFGLTYHDDNGLITHSLSTTVIGANGEVVRWFHSNDWRPLELVKLAASSVTLKQQTLAHSF